MNTTKSKPKNGVTNVIIDKVYVVGPSITLQFSLTITHYYRHTGKILLSKLTKETKKLEKSTRDMVNEKCNGTLDRHKSSSPLLAEEINKNDFLDALNIIINLFGLQAFFYPPDIGNTKMRYLIRESHSHTIQ